MAKKGKKNTDDCKICYGCGGCEDYNNGQEACDLYKMDQYGAGVDINLNKKGELKNEKESQKKEKFKG
jgi:hypothetical protein